MVSAILTTLTPISTFSVPFTTAASIDLSLLVPQKFCKVCLFRLLWLPMRGLLTSGIGFHLQSASESIFIIVLTLSRQRSWRMCRFASISTITFAICALITLSPAASSTGPLSASYSVFASASTAVPIASLISMTSRSIMTSSTTATTSVTTPITISAPLSVVMPPMPTPIPATLPTSLSVILSGAMPWRPIRSPSSPTQSAVSIAPIPPYSLWGILLQQFSILVANHLPAHKLLTLKVGSHALVIIP
mmetsp:Transcript_6135/g.9250  ORF Transcript_6135/g.9250 Transcript_6135/m.9250 type:complete len:248 (+) Transcript_6135:264-1007(+)